MQVPVLELYRSIIADTLEDFEQRSSFLVRAVPGGLVSQSTRGAEGKKAASEAGESQRLLKAYVSAKWMASVISGWGEDMVSTFSCQGRYLTTVSSLSSSSWSFGNRYGRMLPCEIS